MEPPQVESFWITEQLASKLPSFPLPLQAVVTQPARPQPAASFREGFQAMTAGQYLMHFTSRPAAHRANRMFE
jgi:hypothetical protein